MKGSIVVFILGVAVGVGGMLYRDDAKVRTSANTYIDHAVSQGAATAHTALTPAHN